MPSSAWPLTHLQVTREPLWLLALQNLAFIKYLWHTITKLLRSNQPGRSSIPSDLIRAVERTGERGFMLLDTWYSLQPKTKG